MDKEGGLREHLAQVLQPDHPTFHLVVVAHSDIREPRPERPEGGLLHANRVLARDLEGAADPGLRHGVEGGGGEAITDANRGPKETRIHLASNHDEWTRVKIDPPRQEEEPPGEGEPDEPAAGHLPEDALFLVEAGAGPGGGGRGCRGGGGGRGGGRRRDTCLRMPFSLKKRAAPGWRGIGLPASAVSSVRLLAAEWASWNCFRSSKIALV